MLLAHELAHVVQQGAAERTAGAPALGAVPRGIVQRAVYYIVNGSTGVFLPRYTNKETGVREVLYREKTIFRVAKITNYADLTFFVWVDEVDPGTLGLNPQTKNPWSGAVNP